MPVLRGSLSGETSILYRLRRAITVTPVPQSWAARLVYHWMAINQTYDLYVRLNSPIIAGLECGCGGGWVRDAGVAVLGAVVCEVGVLQVVYT